MVFAIAPFTNVPTVVQWIWFLVTVKKRPHKPELLVFFSFVVGHRAGK